MEATCRGDQRFDRSAAKPPVKGDFLIAEKAYAKQSAPHSKGVPMWTRREVKEAGKANFRKQYWKAVVLALLMTLLGGTTSTGSSTSRWSIDITDKIEELPDQIAALIGLGTVAVAIAAIAVGILLINPLKLGISRYFLRLQTEEPADWDVAYFFNHSWENVVKTLFFQGLYIILWTLLLVIPGIIKAYEYRMVPYILAENPDMETNDVLRYSRYLMSGNKWASFVLDLSFILWHILNAITMGLVGLFWLNPYLVSTDAQLYCTLKRLDAQPRPEW